jgi:hypothetical protein
MKFKIYETLKLVISLTLLLLLLLKTVKLLKLYATKRDIYVNKYYPAESQLKIRKRNGGVIC